ncbi:MAG: hypothetical protein N2578_08680 [Bdellovibrionaceae bacterium]|nr:hypothetical protein [Pseudobdellovibrionaceae bacterium]
MEKIHWLKELVKAEQQMEETGLVDMSYGLDRERLLTQETLQFLLQLKTEFVDAITAFNELKTSPLGRVKVYGIAKTHADFMLFRNGYKMIFMMKSPGVIAVRLNFIGTGYIPSPQQEQNSSGHGLMEEQTVEAKIGAFGEVLWTHQGHPVRLEYMVRHYLTVFVRESAK